MIASCRFRGEPFRLGKRCRRVLRPGVCSALGGGREVELRCNRAVYCSRPKRIEDKGIRQAQEMRNISKSLAAPSSWRLGHSSKLDGTQLLRRFSGSLCSQPSSVPRAETACGLCRGSARKTSVAKLKRTVPSNRVRTIKPTVNNEPAGGRRSPVLRNPNRFPARERKCQFDRRLTNERSITYLCLRSTRNRASKRKASNPRWS